MVFFFCYLMHFFFKFSGKTYTMVGTQSDPGLMVLSLNTIFDMIKSDKSADEFEVTCSYLEVYNEVRPGLIKSVFVLTITSITLSLVITSLIVTQVIYDLLERSSGHLELREDPEQGIVVAGLRSIKVHTLHSSRCDKTIRSTA